MKRRRGRRLERTQKQAFTGADAVRSALAPLSTEVPTEANQPPQGGRRVEFSASEGKAGEIRPLAENTHTVIDLQKARENRLLNVSDTGVFAESKTSAPFFEKPRPIDTGENGVNDSASINHDLSKQQEGDSNDPEKETQDKVQIIAMGATGSKLEQFNLPPQKRKEIFNRLADDPNSIVKIAGVIKYLFPGDPMAILEKGAKFRKRLGEALERARQANEEKPKELRNGD